jgi:ADP-ribose pyrophosphatase YjhB (NUDIX family)
MQSGAPLEHVDAPLCDHLQMTGKGRGPFDYHGTLVVVETETGEIVLIHPLGGPLEAPASLPSNPCQPGEALQDAAVRMVREMTGLEVTIVREFTNFIQEGTPTGTMFAHCYVARVAGGVLVDEGPEGPARSYSLDALPAIMPIRVANQRALHAYLEQIHQASDP